MKKCTLDLSFNRCQFFDKKTFTCTKEGYCGLQERPEEKENEEKTEKWYKKYYEDEHWKWK